MKTLRLKSFSSVTCFVAPFSFSGQQTALQIFIISHRTHSMEMNLNWSE